MLKNFTITLVMIGALWSTPVSFTIQEGLGLNAQMASAIPAPTTSVPATRLPTQEAQDPATAFELKCVYKFGINFGDCAAIIGYGLFYVPTSLVLMAGGSIFDAFVALSLDKFLLNQRFVRDTWGVVRDLANLVFILILLWIAIATILNIGGVQLKQAVVNVVIIALLINFSYFFTRVVVDASNVVAWEFYSAIGGGGQVSRGNHIVGVIEYRISEKIVGAVSPQKLLSPETFTAWSKKNDASKGYLFFLFLIGGIVNLVLAYVLFYAGFLLLGRVIAFVFLIIASPLAFISYALPKGGSFTSSWWNQLLSQAMVAPVFLFFLYVIVQLAGAGLTMFNTGGAGSITSNFTEILTTILLKASIVVVALMIALNKTKSLSGAAGSYATKAGTAVFGAAIGTAALAGRHTIGRGARALADSDAGKRFVAKTGVVGEVTDRALRATSSGTMDIRGIPGMDKAGLGRPANKGGYDKHLSEQTKRKVELGKRLEKDKFGNTLTATDWRGKPVTEDVWKERKVMKPSSSGATDSAGNPIMEEVTEKYLSEERASVSAKERYVKGLEKERVRYFAKKEGYKQARADRDAARTLRKVPTEAEKIAEAVAKQIKDQEKSGGGLGEEPKTT